MFDGALGRGNCDPWSELFDRCNCDIGEGGSFFESGAIVGCRGWLVYKGLQNNDISTSCYINRTSIDRCKMANDISVGFEPCMYSRHSFTRRTWSKNVDLLKI